MATARKQDSVGLVKQALAEIRRGRMVILTDDEDRENEGDLVMAAEKVTPAAINFMATHARGLICLTLTEERIRSLNLPLMVHDNTSPYQTAFTVSIEAAKGVTTGISAQDRATTVLAAVAPDAKPGDLSRPGHIFPLRARDGGVLVRTGQTEGSVDLSRLAGLRPAGVICEVMKADGTMARLPELERFAKKHKLVMLSVADIIRYRLEHERLIRRLSERTIVRPSGKQYRAYAFGSDVDSLVHVALVHGTPGARTPVLTRVHRGCVAGDVLGDTGCDCGRQLQSAFDQIEAAGQGVVVYLQKHMAPAQRLACTHTPNEEVVQGAQDQTRLREFGVGAQILKDLGLSRLRLLTDNPKKIVGLESYALEVVEQVPLSAAPSRTRKPRIAARSALRGRRGLRKLPRVD
ncbi:MAG: 3,4-dihydroxy-2-butanone-4-phosphate synthase [Myxococcota bacterium]|nr:3,4-dihydroxy-2-butanone-4-phosphate synthase [Myxococcota bacterium]